VIQSLHRWSKSILWYGLCGLADVCNLVHGPFILYPPFLIRRCPHYRPFPGRVCSLYFMSIPFFSAIFFSSWGKGSFALPHWIGEAFLTRSYRPKFFRTVLFFPQSTVQGFLLFCCATPVISLFGLLHSLESSIRSLRKLSLRDTRSGGGVAPECIRLFLSSFELRRYPGIFPLSKPNAMDRSQSAVFTIF